MTWLQASSQNHPLFEGAEVTQTVDNAKKNRTKGRKALWVAVISIIAWLSIGGFSGAAFSKISTVQENDNSAFLPQNAESTLASKVTVKFSDQAENLLPTLLLIVGDVSPQNNPDVFERSMVMRRT